MLSMLPADQMGQFSSLGATAVISWLVWYLFSRFIPIAISKFTETLETQRHNYAQHCAEQRKDFLAALSEQRRDFRAEMEQQRRLLLSVTGGKPLVFATEVGDREPKVEGLAPSDL